MATHGSLESFVDYDDQSMSSPDRTNRVTSPVVELVSRTTGADGNIRRNDTALCRGNARVEPVQMAANLPIAQYVDILMHILCQWAYKLPERTDNRVQDANKKLDEPVLRETVV